MTTRHVVEALCSHDDVEILEATEAAAYEYGYRYGAELICLRPEHIKALQEGKMLAWNNDEYSTFVVLSSPDKSSPSVRERVRREMASIIAEWVAGGAHPDGEEEQ